LLKSGGEKSFINSTSTLVALLITSGRAEAAKKVSEQAVKELNNTDFRKALKKALDGIPPKPWP
jgi:hypothetical protein